MSADNWAICPRCQWWAEVALKAKAKKVNEAYGKVPVDEFDRMRQELQTCLKAALDDLRRGVNKTLREDYSFEMGADGQLTVRYSGFCSTCKFTANFDAKQAYDI